MSTITGPVIPQFPLSFGNPAFAANTTWIYSGGYMPLSNSTFTQSAIMLPQILSSTSLNKTAAFLADYPHIFRERFFLSGLSSGSGGPIGSSGASPPSGSGRDGDGSDSKLKRARELISSVFSLGMEIHTPDIVRETISNVGLSKNDAIELLLYALDHGAHSHRRDAAYVLGVVGYKDDLIPALPLLRRALEDEYLQEAVAYALSNSIPDSESVPGLIKTLKNKRPGARVWAARALGRFGSVARAAGPALSAVTLHDPDDSVVREARGALQDIGPWAVPEAQGESGRRQYDGAMPSLFVKLSEVFNRLSKFFSGLFGKES